MSGTQRPWVDLLLHPTNRQAASKGRFRRVTGRIGQLVQGALRAHAAQHNEGAVTWRAKTCTGTMPATMPGTMPGMGKGSAMGSMLASGTLPNASTSVGMSAGGRMPGILAGMEMSVKGSLLGKGIPAGKGSMPAGMESMPGIGTMPSALSVPAMVTPASLS